MKIVITENQLLNVLSEVRVKEGDRNKIYEDENILVVAPLTHKASCKYGANAKWCTAVPSNQEHFNEYMEDGVLIYFIIRSPHKETKKPEYKFAYYHPFDEEHSDSKGWYDMSDNQLTVGDVETEDSIDINLIKFLIPDNIFKLVKDYIKTQKPIWLQKQKEKKIKTYEYFINDPDNINNTIVNNANWLITYRLKPFDGEYDNLDFGYVYTDFNSRMTIMYVNKKTKNIYYQNLDFYIDLRNFINGKNIENRTSYHIEDLNNKRHPEMFEVFKKYYSQILKAFFKVRKEVYNGDIVYMPPQYIEVGDYYGTSSRNLIKIDKVEKQQGSDMFKIDGVDSTGNHNYNLYYNREIGAGIKYNKEKHNPV
jgi:hypothetical protein